MLSLSSSASVALVERWTLSEPGAKADGFSQSQKTALNTNTKSKGRFDNLIWSGDYSVQWQVGERYGEKSVAWWGDFPQEALNQVAVSFDTIQGFPYTGYHLDNSRVESRSEFNPLHWQVKDFNVVFGARHTAGMNSAIVNIGELASDGNAYLYSSMVNQDEASSVPVKASIVPYQGAVINFMLLVAVAKMLINRCFSSTYGANLTKVSKKETFF
tara:strand:+ start:3148 stop:3792 length:645 start_codon:yes stop_codon:yes gene_type:complete